MEFVGVWDTDGALGIPIDGFRAPLVRRLWAFHDTTFSRYVRNAYHTIAIDERRRPFRPTLWAKKAERRTRRWSRSGSRACTVTSVGGTAIPSSRRSPFCGWPDKARACGLSFKRDHLVVKLGSFDPEDRRAGLEVAPHPDGQLDDSRTRFYRLLPAYDRGLAGENRADVDGGSLASSAKTRHGEDDSYRPPGLPEWLAANRAITPVQDGR